MSHVPNSQISSTASKDVKIAPGAVVCLESKLRGNITVGSMTVIHPKASIIAEAGPILIGENNIIEEQSSIIYTSSAEVNKENALPLTIGVNNVFEVGCEIRAKSIGDHNVFEPKCFVGPDVEIGNGCIIGAGCRITVAEKLPDQTVITGSQCIRSVALDKPPDSDDLVRQHDEITAMSEIFTKEEFCNCSTDAEVCAKFQAHIPLPRNFLLSLSKNTAQTNFAISYLPPLNLIVFLPQNYPSQRPPDFLLSCCWLTKRKLDHLTKELQKLWEENKCEILYIWCSFLKDQSLDFLNIINGYDLSERFFLHKGKANILCGNGVKEELKKDACPSVCNTSVDSSMYKGKKYKTKLGGYKDRKAYVTQNKFADENDFFKEQGKLKLIKQGCENWRDYEKEAMKRLYFSLIEYNASKAKEEFKKSLQVCNVCFSHVLGDLSKQLPCSHITCEECLKRMCEVHIKHGTLESLVCPQEECGLEIPVNMIRELVTKELYEQYDRLMLNRTLDKISNMTYCPRIHCQYPVSTQGEDNLAVCPNCRNAFCLFCKRAYHGVEGCRLRNDEKRELIDAYQNGDYEKRLELEKRYGKKQLIELVNTAQSELWMSENSKKCPCCHVNIEKTDGCNKMICRKCNTNFCWMCLTRLSSLNPYLHFQDPKSRCFNLLFEGIYEHHEEDNIHEENEIDDDGAAYAILI